MKTSSLRAVLFVLIVTLSATISAQEPQAGKPHLQWKIGDSWLVRVWMPLGGQPEYGTRIIKSHFDDKVTDDVLFKVTGKEQIRGYECFKLEETHPPDYRGWQRRKILFYRCDTGNLVRITVIAYGERHINKDVSLEPDSPLMPHGEEFGAFPVWGKDDIEPKGGVAKPDVCKQKVVREKANGHSAYTFDEVEAGEIGKPASIKRKVTQEWRPGEPWWHEMHLYQGEQELSKAILLPESIGATSNKPAANRPN